MEIDRQERNYQSQWLEECQEPVSDPICNSKDNSCYKIEHQSLPKTKNKQFALGTLRKNWRYKTVCSADRCCGEVEKLQKKFSLDPKDEVTLKMSE